MPTPYYSKAMNSGEPGSDSGRDEEAARLANLFRATPSAPVIYPASVSEFSGSEDGEGGDQEEPGEYDELQKSIIGGVDGETYEDREGAVGEVEEDGDLATSLELDSADLFGGGEDGEESADLGLDLSAEELGLSEVDLDMGDLFDGLGDKPENSQESQENSEDQGSPEGPESLPDNGIRYNVGPKQKRAYSTAGYSKDVYLSGAR
jgi:hypothetical protein